MALNASFDFVRNLFGTGFGSVFNENYNSISERNPDIAMEMCSNQCSIANIANIAHINHTYYRSVCTRTTIDLWRTIVDMNHSYVFNNQIDFTRKLAEVMSSENDKPILDCNSIVDNAIDNRLIIGELDKTNNRFRLVANRDRNAFNNLTHDWYCFECHSDDEQLITIKLIQCDSCWRSFHSQCVESETQLDSDITQFRCDYCRKQSQQTITDASIGDTNRLNKLLKYILINCDYFMGEQMYDTLSFNQLSDLFVFKPFELKQIESKISSNAYQCLNEFENDIKHFEHNFVVSPKYLDESIAKHLNKFRKLFAHELSELKICVDCYQYSNELQYNNANESPNDWFCEVCSPPHQLVYARVKKYSYWPSKLLRVTDNGLYDVRFFDPPNFSRGLVTKDKIKPITHRFNSEFILKWKLEQPIRLMMRYMKKLDSNGLVIEQNITNNDSIKYEDFVKMISPILNCLKRKNQTNNNNDEKVVKKTKKKSKTANYRNVK